MACLEWPDGTRYDLTGDSATIGRDRVNDIVVFDDSRVSRLQAEMQYRDERWLLVDMRSRNGTFVNGRRIHQHPLRDGDRLQFGAITLVFCAGDDPNVTAPSEAVGDEGPRLSRREQQVVALVVEGLTDREIGERLFISTSTVRSHLDRVAEKTGSRRRIDLMRRAADLDRRG